MFKKSFFTILLFLIFCNFLICNDVELHEESIYEVLKKKSEFYKINIHNEGQYSIQFYGINNNYDDLKHVHSAITSDSTQLIYFKNITGRPRIKTNLDLWN